MTKNHNKKSQQAVKIVMHEFKRGKLKIGKSNKPVKDPKQAIAIGLSKAREVRSLNAKQKSSSK